MLQSALAWGSSYMEAVVLSYHGCCCSSDPRDDAQGQRDLVVPTEWDTREQPLEPLGQFSDPAAVQGLACSDRSEHHEPGPPRPGRTPNGTPRRKQETPRGLQQDDAGDGPREALALRELMKRFVQDMIVGRTFYVVIEDGQTEPCKLSLAHNLMHMQLEAAGTTHDIPLKNVKDVCPGKLPSSRFTPINLDELCNTLVLRNNECVTFRLSSIKERDEFTKCVKVLALALEQ